MTACNVVEMTRREEQKEERRHAILAVARKAFHEHGYGGTTMSGIAAKLGGSKGTLWAYFPSKEALFAATMDSLVDDFAGSFQVDLKKDLRIGLMDYCTDFLGMMLSPGVIALNRLIIAEAPRFPELGCIFYERGPKRRQRILSDYFAAHIEAGNLEPMDTLLAAGQLHHLCQARLFTFTLWGVADRVTDFEIRDDAAAAVRLFLDGYGAGETAVIPGPVQA